MDDGYDDAFRQAQQELLKAIAASARLVTRAAEIDDKDGLVKSGETATSRMANGL